MGGKIIGKKFQNVGQMGLEKRGRKGGERSLDMGKKRRRKAKLLRKNGQKERKQGQIGTK